MNQAMQCIQEATQCRRGAGLIPCTVSVVPFWSSPSLACSCAALDHLPESLLIACYAYADPTYKTSDSKAADFLELENLSDNKQQRLPSYKNMFSALPERYPSYSLRYACALQCAALQEMWQGQESQS